VATLLSHTKDKIMKIVRLVVAACALALMGGVAPAQPAKTLKQQLVGTWDHVVSEATTSDGKKLFPFGEKPNGTIMFTDDGRFVQVHIKSDIPKIASNNRATATPDENKAVVGGTIALFGTYTVDEEKKLVTFKVKASTYPNWDGVEQPRKIVTLNATEFVNENPGASVGTGATAINKYTRAK
jgi:hypothetical protein